MLRRNTLLSKKADPSRVVLRPSKEERVVMRGEVAMKKRKTMMTNLMRKSRQSQKIPKSLQRFYRPNPSHTPLIRTIYRNYRTSAINMAAKVDLVPQEGYQLFRMPVQVRLDNSLLPNLLATKTIVLLTAMAKTIALLMDMAKIIVQLTVTIRVHPLLILTPIDDNRLNSLTNLAGALLRIPALDNPRRRPFPIDQCGALS